MSAEKVATTMPAGERCPIGPLNAHTYNYEHDECIWCGPNGLGWKPGRWVPLGDGLSAWSVGSPTRPGIPKTGDDRD
jgi:hypothetical protein